MNVNNNVVFCQNVYFKVGIDSSSKLTDLNECMQDWSKNKNKKTNKQ